MDKDLVIKVFNEVRDWAFNLVKANAPYRTGDLMRSFRLEILPNGFAISTDIDYMIYTEMQWTFNSRWGKTLINPNEMWFRNTAIVIAEEMSRRLGGLVYVIN